MPVDIYSDLGVSDDGREEWMSQIPFDSMTIEK